MAGAFAAALAACGGGGGGAPAPMAPATPEPDGALADSVVYSGVAASSLSSAQERAATLRATLTLNGNRIDYTAHPSSTLRTRQTTSPQPPAR
jgi:hypothetical protein